MKYYRIRDWESRYENKDTRKIKDLRWIPLPVKHDGLAFKRIAMRKDACEVFTAWILMLQIASKGNHGERGTLCRDNLPLTPEDMGMMTGYRPDVFSRALETLASANIGWLEVYKESPDVPGESPDVAGNDARYSTVQYRTEQDKTGQDKPSSSEADDGFGVFWKYYPRKIGKAAAEKAWNRSKRPSLPAILEKIEALKASDQWRKDGGQYIPHAATWINRGGWDDEPEQQKPSGPSLHFRDADEVMKEIA